MSTTLDVTQTPQAFATTEEIFWGLDFTNVLNATETIASSSSEMLGDDGSAIILATPHTDSDNANQINQQIDGSLLTAGVVYNCIITISTSTGNKKSARLKLSVPF